MAERLADEQANVSIFAMGVGRGVEKTELERIIAVCGADKVRGPSRKLRRLGCASSTSRVCTAGGPCARQALQGDGACTGACRLWWAERGWGAHR